MVRTPSASASPRRKRSASHSSGIPLRFPSTLGAVLGLSAQSVLYAAVGSHWESISILVLFALAAPFIVRLAFPETSGRALDEISPERG